MPVRHDRTYETEAYFCLVGSAESILVYGILQVDSNCYRLNDSLCGLS
jgi:hypothetical protein